MFRRSARTLFNSGFSISATPFHVRDSLVLARSLRTRRARPKKPDHAEDTDALNFLLSRSPDGRGETRATQSSSDSDDKRDDTICIKNETPLTTQALDEQSHRSSAFTRYDAEQDTRDLLEVGWSPQPGLAGQLVHPSLDSNAHSFFSTLSDLLDAPASGRPALEFLRASQWFQDGLESSLVGIEERDLLRAAVRNVASWEFSSDSPDTVADLQHRQDSTLWVLQAYKSRGLDSAQYWHDALTRGAVSLSSRYDLPASRPLKSPEFPSALEKLDYKSLHNHGLQLDSLVHVWRHFKVHFSTPSGQQEGPDQLRSPNGAYHDALVSRMSVTAAGLDNADKLSLASAALLTSYMSMDSWRLRTLEDQASTTSGTKLSQSSGSGNKGIMQNFTTRLEDRTLNMAVAAASQDTAINRTLLKLNLAKLGIPVGISLDLLRFSERLQDLGNTAIQYLGKGTDGPSKSRDRVLGRFDTRICALLRELDSPALYDATAWLLLTEEALFNKHSHRRLIDTLKRRISMESDSAQRQSVQLRCTEISRRWRKRVSAQIRSAVTRNNLTDLEDAWHTHQLSKSAEDPIVVVWWYHRLKLRWKLRGPRHAVHAFTEVCSSTESDTGLNARGFRRLANHILHWESCHRRGSRKQLFRTLSSPVHWQSMIRSAERFADREIIERCTLLLERQLTWEHGHAEMLTLIKRTTPSAGWNGPNRHVLNMLTDIIIGRNRDIDAKTVYRTLRWIKQPITPGMIQQVGVKTIDFLLNEAADIAKDFQAWFPNQPHYRFLSAMRPVSQWLLRLRKRSRDAGISEEACKRLKAVAAWIRRSAERGTKDPDGTKSSIVAISHKPHSDRQEAHQEPEETLKSTSSSPQAIPCGIQPETRQSPAAKVRLTLSGSRSRRAHEWVAEDTPALLADRIRRVKTRISRDCPPVT